MRLRYALTILLLPAAVALRALPARQTSIQFEIATNFESSTGRLIVVISQYAGPEPRMLIGEAGADAPVLLGRDVRDLRRGGAAVVVDRAAETFPISSLDALPRGDYYVQAVLLSNRDLRAASAPGNSYSDVQRVRIDVATGGVFRLQLSHAIPPEHPPDDEYVKFITIRSNLLTQFHRRPMYLRAGVILPKDYATAGRQWPLRVHIGGYGSRYTVVRRLMSPGSEFRRMWLDDETPRFIYLQLDGEGPNGDPYQVNSDNNGPYGDAITRELIPYVERKFHAIGEPYSRVLDGESTGGWVSLALKIFYPDFFNAVWSACPDGVDFRAFQIIDIYKDRNAYVDERGRDRPSKRDGNGNVEFSIRRECQMENVIGIGGSWTLSGRQWGAWNATYGPRGRNGLPAPLWDPKTGIIDRSVVNHWKKYDLRMILQQNWPALAPKLRGKIHISVGDADDYYLNNAVHLLDEFFKTASPPADAQIVYGPGRGHCFENLSEIDKMKDMARAIAAARER